MFNNKKDPLHDIAKNVIQHGTQDRQIIENINADLGIQNRKQLPIEYKAEYDKIVAEAIATKSYSPKQKKLAALAGNPKKIDASDLAAARAGHASHIEEEEKQPVKKTVDKKEKMILVAPKGYTGAGKVSRIPKKEYDPEKHSLVSEAAYSAKAAKAGKDIGKPGKMFAKIEKEASKRYGSEESGKNVAGAVLAKIRAKHMKEEAPEVIQQKDKLPAPSTIERMKDYNPSEKYTPKVDQDYSGSNISQKDRESLTKKIESLKEGVTRKHFQMVADLIKGHKNQDKRNELASHHAGIFTKQNPRFDKAKFFKAANAEMPKEQLEEKAVSKAQHRFFGLVRGIQKGEAEGSPKAEKAAKEMTTKEVRKFAKTKEKGLPEKVDEDISSIHEEIANNLFEKYKSLYEANDEAGLREFFDSLSEEQIEIMEILRPIRPQQPASVARPQTNQSVDDAYGTRALYGQGYQRQTLFPGTSKPQQPAPAATTPPSPALRPQSAPAATSPSTDPDRAAGSSIKYGANRSTAQSQSAADRQPSQTTTQSASKPQTNQSTQQQSPEYDPRFGQGAASRWISMQGLNDGQQHESFNNLENFLRARNGKKS